MLTMVTRNTRRAVTAVAAMAIVGVAGLGLDQAHVAAARHGTVEVGELTPIGLEKLAQVTLPEIVITAERQAPGGYRFATHARPHGLGILSALVRDGQ